MDDKKQHLVTTLAHHAEDIALLMGVLLLGIGAGAAFGVPYGLMVAGFLSVAYGVWITERRP